MYHWAPIPDPTADISRLGLSPEERYLFLSLDGYLSVAQLSGLTGYSPDQIVQAMVFFARAGAIVPDNIPTSLQGYIYEQPHAFAYEEVSGPSSNAPGEGIYEEPFVQHGQGIPQSYPEHMNESNGPDAGYVEQQPYSEQPYSEQPYSEQPYNEQPDNEQPDNEQQEIENTRNYRQMYTQYLRHMTPAQRATEALYADANVLMAFSLDPMPEVIHSVLQNAHVGFPHARLIAMYHHTTAGLELLCQHAAFVRDHGVQRALFKNPQVPQGVLRRIVQNKPLLQVWNLTNSRDLTAQVKSSVREMFRGKFQQSTAEERVSLIIKCEGRCLRRLSGIPLCDQTTTLLCRRAMHSTMLLRNLATFPATPPRLLLHMFKQPAIKRNTSLRNLILQHPNTPANLKRNQR